MASQRAGTISISKITITSNDSNRMEQVKSKVSDKKRKEFAFVVIKTNAHFLLHSADKKHFPA